MLAFAITVMMLCLSSARAHAAAGVPRTRVPAHAAARYMRAASSVAASRARGSAARAPIRLLASAGRPAAAGTAPRLVAPEAEAASPVAGLHLLNSLSREKEPFQPLSGGRFVSWYICGPTVYDSAHLGHLRNYVGFDILRRVLEEYFGYDICYVMNITDIDDKIIMRAHRRRLAASLDALAGAAAAASGDLAAAIAAVSDERLRGSMARAAALLEEKERSIADVMALQAELREAASAAGGPFATLAADPSAGPLRDCDAQLDTLALAREFEEEFFSDMRRMGVRPPCAVTRVTEYVDEIVSYIQTIEANGYCYATDDGSVYFDTGAFAEVHTYGKLEPSAIGNAELLGEGEGALSAGGGGGKRKPQDFALWKASKAGEPAWPSPWGDGRPGWHIECSAMASDLLGAAVDINAGGADLRFPHHENQMAQCEAHYDCDRWVSTFLHSGHLDIDGRKMSKSLKNFITVGEALQSYSPSQLRFLFLLHKHSDPMEYSPNAMEAAAAMHARFAEFGASLDVRLREGGALLAREPGACAHKWGAAERALGAELHAKRAAVHAALCDSVDTPAALRQLEQLLRETNRYLAGTTAATANRPLLLDISRFFAKLYGAFGLTDAAESERFAQPFALRADGGGGGGGGGGGTPGGAAAAPGSAAAGADAAAISREEIAGPIVEVLAEFRERVRALAASGADAGALLAECDALRDRDLKKVGVRLEDRSGEAARWMLVSPADLEAEAAAAAKEERKKAQAREAVQAKEAARLAMRAVPPEQMFRPENDVLFGREAPFTQWDDSGLPTHGADGEPLSKGARKRAEKAFSKHKANFEK